jgi:hypothetical protein
MGSLLANAKVVEVLAPMRIVINRGNAHQVRVRQRFLVYAIGEMMTDPDTGERLGGWRLCEGRAR